MLEAAFLFFICSRREMRGGHTWSTAGCHAKRDAMDTGQAAGAATQTLVTGETPAAETWDTFYAGLTDERKGLVDAHAKGLKASLEAARGERNDLDKKLKQLAKAAEEGSEMQKQVQALQAQLKSANERAAFVDEAPGRGVSNVNAAYKLAVSDGLIGDGGTADWTALKERYPELFKSQTPVTVNTNGKERGVGTVTDPQDYKKSNLASGRYTRF